MSRRVLFTMLFGAALLRPVTVPAAPPRLEQIGAGSVARGLPAGAKGPPATIFATEKLRERPLPTNDWWSSLAWLPLSERQYPHPLAVCAGSAGLRIDYPGPRIHADKSAIFGFMLPDKCDLTLGHSTQPSFAEARVSDYSDWFVSAQFGDPKRGATFTYGHGCPFVYANYSGGTPTVSFGEPPRVWSGDATSPVIGLSVANRHYGLFAPQGATWEGWGGNTWTCRTAKSYFSIAVLPDASKSTLELFRHSAYSHVTDSRVSWAYDESTATLTTTYSVSTVPVEGNVRDTLFALYPHQWRHTQATLRPESYVSVRGQMRLTSGTEFHTRMQFPGVLPCLPDSGGCDRAKITAWLEREVSQPVPPIKDTYWEGKWLGQQATFLTLADQYQLSDVSRALQDRIASRLESWFTANEPGKEIKQAGLFCYDDTWGTLIGYPASFGSDVELNDHHFHYGYYIRAAAEIAVHDPQWADTSRWGGVVQRLIRDIASLDRADPQFPFLRNFDPFAGHSWAAGHAKFGDGNNNESSSEAMNAWYGILLWGQATGDRALRDLGIYLYTTELAAIEEYWFDVHDENHPSTYTPSVVTMVWGGKGANGTWFSADPEMVHGINWLPIHGGSLYLGRFPEYVEKNYGALCEENGNTNWSAWSDLIWMYRALTDPDDARTQFDAGGEKLVYEAGNSAANTYHWIANLQRLGQVDCSVSADYPFAATFLKDGKRTHVAYNPEQKPRTIRFSDGKSITVAPNTMGVQR